jgi:hypothetical protein
MRDKRFINDNGFCSAQKSCFTKKQCIPLSLPFAVSSDQNMTTHGRTVAVSSFSSVTLNTRQFVDLASISWNPLQTLVSTSTQRAKRVYDGSSVCLMGSSTISAATGQTFGVTFVDNGNDRFNYQTFGYYSNTTACQVDITYVDDTYFTMIMPDVPFSNTPLHIIYFNFRDGYGISMLSVTNNPGGRIGSCYYRFSFDAQGQIRGITPKVIDSWDGQQSSAGALDGCFTCVGNYGSHPAANWTFSPRQKGNSFDNSIQFRIITESPYMAALRTFDRTLCCVSTPANATELAICQDRDLKDFNAACETYMVGRPTALGVCKDKPTDPNCIAFCKAVTTRTSDACDTIYTTYCATKDPVTDKALNVCGTLLLPQHWGSTFLVKQTPSVIIRCAARAKFTRLQSEARAWLQAALRSTSSTA